MDEEDSERLLVKAFLGLSGAAAVIYGAEYLY